MHNISQGIIDNAQRIQYSNGRNNKALLDNKTEQAINFGLWGRAAFAAADENKRVCGTVNVPWVRFLFCQESYGGLYEKIKRTSCNACGA